MNVFLRECDSMTQCMNSASNFLQLSIRPSLTLAEQGRIENTAHRHNASSRSRSAEENVGYLNYQLNFQVIFKIFYGNVELRTTDRTLSRKCRLFETYEIFKTYVFFLFFIISNLRRSFSHSYLENQEFLKHIYFSKISGTYFKNSDLSLTMASSLYSGLLSCSLANFSYSCLALARVSLRRNTLTGVIK